MTRPFAVGQEVGIAKLRKMYDEYATVVLGLYLEEKPPREKRQHRRFEVKRDLPDRDEYFRLKNRRYTISLENLLEEAYSEFESLAEEMREWYDNLPENLQGGDKGCQLEEVADILEGIDAIEYPAVEESFDTVFFDSLNCSSRAARCAEAASKLRHVADTIREKIEDKENDLSESDRDELSSFADEIENQADEADGAEFPSMFG